MRNIKLVLEYDGSRYQGWQRLGKDESSNTISTKLMEVIQKMTGGNTELFCGARTEVGVHAHGQCVNFKTTCDMKELEIKHYLNRYLPMDIAVLSAEDVPERFHASLNAKSRTYIYRINTADVPSVFERKYIYHSFKRPDTKLMQRAATAFIGKHDFKDVSTVKRTKSTIKELLDLSIYDDGDEIQITLEATDFLHNMPRMLVSTLIDIGLGTRKLEEIAQILDPDSPIAASAPADPKGLYLKDILYL